MSDAKYDAAKALLLEREKLSDRNKQLILKFVTDYCDSAGLSTGRKVKYLNYLAQFAVVIGKDLDVAEKEDLQKAVAWIENEAGFAEWTKVDCKKMLKKYYRFTEGDDDEAPKKIRWLKRLTIPRHKRKVPSVLSKEDITKLLRYCHDERETAIIMWLYYTGVRPGEFCAMQRKDLETGDGSASLWVHGKTGVRRLVIESDDDFKKTLLATMKAWLNKHPDSSGDAPLWCGRFKSQLRITALCIFLERLCKRAGIKPVPPKTFRSTSATHKAADGWSAHQLMKWHGWDDLKTPLHYIDLAGVGDTGKRADKASLQAIRCWSCGCANPPHYSICSACSSTLNMTEMERKIKATDMIMDEVLKASPELKKLIEKAAERVADKLAGVVQQAS